MSQMFPNTKDSIKEKCAKACFLYMTDYIDEEQLLTWLIQYKYDFQEIEVKFDQQTTIHKNMSSIFQ